MSIYKAAHYKSFINDWLENQPGRGRGLLTKIAAEIGIHTTLLSHTIRGEKHLTVEQALHLAEFIGLNEQEADCFLLLVQIERAGTARLKNKFKRDLERLRSKSSEIVNRVPTSTAMTEEKKSVFYSSWLYSALRQITCLEKYQTREALLSAFPVSREELNRALDFLLQTGLCREDKKKIVIGPAKTHLEAKSPFVYMHHKNWRLKGMEKHGNLSPEELMYSAPFTISQEDFEAFREQIVKLIESLVRTTDQTKSERLACFNVDLFYVK